MIGMAAELDRWNAALKRWAALPAHRQRPRTATGPENTGATCALRPRASASGVNERCAWEQLRDAIEAVAVGEALTGAR